MTMFPSSVWDRLIGPIHAPAGHQLTPAQYQRVIALPDMWGDGLDDGLFLWMHIGHINPAKDRIIFSCPPRAYYVLAALRLAKLVESIRKKQADIPITIVCHSQGNMIGMTAAFFGDTFKPAVDTAGVAGRCVADSYVLCNPPYSLRATNLSEDWGESAMRDKQLRWGRQTRAARIKTLKAFFDIIRRPVSRPLDVPLANWFMGNEKHGYEVADDQKRYSCGAAASTYRRVTLYCNPHDQVISALPVQGIGWLGMSKAEIDDTNGSGVFSQRVFAQDYAVGAKGTYNYWTNHHRKPPMGRETYWYPLSPQTQYSVRKGSDTSRGRVVGQVLTFLMAPLAIAALKLAGQRINAIPDENWAIPLDAPDLPSTFKPKAARFGTPSDPFEQAYDAPGQSRDKKRVHTSDDRKRLVSAV